MHVIGPPDRLAFVLWTTQNPLSHTETKEFMPGRPGSGGHSDKANLRDAQPSVRFPAIAGPDESHPCGSCQAGGLRMPGR